MRWILYGLISVAVYILLHWIYFFIKALKDPKVREASNIGMNVSAFKKYEVLYDELQEVYRKYGTQSEEATNFFKQHVWPKVKSNPNGWRRYQEYRLKQYQQEFADYINKTLYNRYK